MAESIRVLHVDDGPGLTKVTAEFLEREDDRFEVTGATNASEGLERLAVHKIDCIVSDHDMPRRNGIEFLEAVREDYPDLPFVLFTGKGSEAVASDAISAGATDYLQKESGTGQYAVLANRIENAVAQYREELRYQYRYTALFENTDDAIVWIELDGGTPTVEDANGAFESGYSTADDGTGFGLNIVRRIAEAHGWASA